MKICISTIGTRGDVQPYMALGRGLQAAALGEIIRAEDGVGQAIAVINKGLSDE